MLAVFCVNCLLSLTGHKAPGTADTQPTPSGCPGHALAMPTLSRLRESLSLASSAQPVLCKPLMMGFHILGSDSDR